MWWRRGKDDGGSRQRVWLQVEAVVVREGRSPAGRVLVEPGSPQPRHHHSSLHLEKWVPLHERTPLEDYKARACARRACLLLILIIIIILLRVQRICMMRELDEEAPHLLLVPGLAGADDR